MHSEEVSIALGSLGDPQAVTPLIAALGDEDAWVRKEIARALGTLGDARAVDSLLAALGDEAWPARSGAVMALSTLSDARAIQPLRILLTDPNAEVIEQVTRAIAQLEARQAKV